MQICIYDRKYFTCYTCQNIFRYSPQIWYADLLDPREGVVVKLVPYKEKASLHLSCYMDLLFVTICYKKYCMTWKEFCTKIYFRLNIIIFLIANLAGTNGMCILSFRLLYKQKKNHLWPVLLKTNNDNNKFLIDHIMK